jgi:peptidoglycan lytic transglycosylase
MRLGLQVTLASFALVAAILFAGVKLGLAGETVCGSVSWYGKESGTRTYTGERFDGSSLTMAMPSTRHIGERWRVFYRGRSIDLRVNDYGPRADLHRIADLSHEAARRIGLIHAGVDRLCMTRLQ